jgi:MFS family permease
VIESLSPEGRLLFAARALRSFAFGWLSVVLALFLARRGLSSAQIGFVFTATMVEDALLTMLLSSFAARVGPARIMAWTAPLLTVGGVLLVIAEDPRVLILGAVLGTLSPNGQEAGPFSPMEQAILPDTVPLSARNRAFAWYNVFAFLPAALGSLAAGIWLGAARLMGLDDLAAYHRMFWAYSAAGVLLALLYSRLWRSRRGLAPGAEGIARGGLHRSRRVVLELSALQGLDALAGGFIIQSLLAYWFHLRFGVGAESLGPLFFGTSLLSALSFLAASRVADRVGLLNTMVFTHLPSNVLLLAVPFMPTFPLAAAVLLARHVLSQMDVPARQAYTVALVAPEERPAAAGFTSSVRALAQSVAPALSGSAMVTAATGLPFFLAGGLKIVYDLGLYARFRKVPLRND